MKKATQRYSKVVREMDFNGGTAEGGAYFVINGLSDLIDDFPDTPVNPMDLIQAEHLKWTEKNFPDQVADDCFKGVVEEVGELAHADLKKKQGIRGDAEGHDAEARDAVGDIMIYLMGYCSKRGWAMSEILEETWGKVVSKRDWVKYPGNGIDK